MTPKTRISPRSRVSKRIGAIAESATLAVSAKAAKMQADGIDGFVTIAYSRRSAFVSDCSRSCSSMSWTV